MSGDEFEPVIGLEIHAQLATASKLFCSCPARLAEGVSVSDVGVNLNTCPVCTGHPGTLPVLNKKAVEYAIRAGLAMGCKINLKSVFSRKNYFYPDLPKGYQISQYETPVCGEGWLDIETDGSKKRVTIQRIHLEEDAGKSVHMSGFSLVNLNRACIPLIEIVSGPDLRSAQEAGAYLRSVHAIVTSIGICDGNMQEGNFRCDANVSVRPRGFTGFGTRAEIKNVNSFRFVEKAIEHEISRQVALIRAGGKVVQETRTYDADKNVTIAMRSKEEAHDYRYFPEPDLIPLSFEEAWVEEIRGLLPELPEQKKQRYMNDFALSSYDAGVLTSSASLSLCFDSVLKALANPSFAKPAANLLIGEVARLMNEGNIEIEQSKLTAAHIVEVVKALDGKEISATAAKQVLVEAWNTGEEVSRIVVKLGLKQVSNVDDLLPAVKEVIARNPTQVSEFRAGKEKLLGFFVGQVMKSTGGKANPALLQELIRQELLK